MTLLSAFALAGCNSYTTDMAAVGTCQQSKTADDLIKYCDAALKLDLEWYMQSPVYNDRGLGYMLKKQYDLALADFDQAIKLRNHEPVLYANRGDAYSGKHDFDKALADYDHALALAPGFTEAYIHRGLVYLWKREDDKALSNFDTAVRMGRGDANALMFRAVGYLAIHDYTKATADFRRALDLQPDSAAAEDGLCRSLALLGQTYEAIRHCERAAKAAPKPAGPLFARGYAELRNGDWKAALADCGAAADMTPVAAAPLFCRGYAHERLGEADAANADYAAARAADGKIDEGMKRLGIVPGSAKITPEA